MAREVAWQSVDLLLITPTTVGHLSRGVRQTLWSRTDLCQGGPGPPLNRNAASYY